MAELEQTPFGVADFADNPEPRCPCLLLLDTSHSMQGAPIQELNEGLAAFKAELAKDSLAVKRVELALMTFGPVTLVSDFQTSDLFVPPTLATTGDTPMGSAISQGLELLKNRKGVYKSNGVSYYRPWVFLITDGSPTDSVDAAAAAVKDGEQSKAHSFFPVGIQNADMTTLAQLSTRAPMKLQGLAFRELFSWLSSSLSGVSRSQVGQAVKLEQPTWNEV